MTSAFQTLLSQQSDESLRRLKQQLASSRERLKSELAGVAYEEEQVDLALAKSARKATARTSSGKTRLSADKVLEVVNRNFSGQFNSSHVVTAFAEEGIETNGEAVRQHLRRLADEGRLLREGNGFAPTAAARLSRPSPQASPNGLPPAGEGRELSFGVGT